jgi:hypothetical protein
MTSKLKSLKKLQLWKPRPPRDTSVHLFDQRDLPTQPSKTNLYLHFIHCILQDHDKFQRCVMMMVLLSCVLMGALYYIHIILIDLRKGMQLWSLGNILKDRYAKGSTSDIICGLITILLNPQTMLLKFSSNMLMGLWK